MIALVEYKGQWYRVEKGNELGPRTIQFFDTVVSVNDGVYAVIKDRRSDREKQHGLLTLIKMKLFAEGKTLNDLPLFVDDPADKKFPNGPLNLGMDEDGNLVTFSAINAEGYEL